MLLRINRHPYGLAGSPAHFFTFHPSDFSLTVGVGGWLEPIPTAGGQEVGVDPGRHQLMAGLTYGNKQPSALTVTGQFRVSN